MQLPDLIIDLFHQTRTSLMLYGVQISAECCNQNNMNDPIYINLMKMMTHSAYKDVRRACIDKLRSPYSHVSLLMMGKRLRDKDEDIRR